MKKELVVRNVSRIPSQWCQESVNKGLLQIAFVTEVK